MKHYRLNSSNILSAGYDLATQKLEVLFKSGKLYTYENVPADYWATLTSSESVGRWLVANVKADTTAHPYSSTDVDLKTFRFESLLPSDLDVANARIATLEAQVQMLETRIADYLKTKGY